MKVNKAWIYRFVNDFEESYGSTSTEVWFISLAFCALFVVFLSGTAKAQESSPGCSCAHASHSTPKRANSLGGRIGWRLAGSRAPAAVPCLVPTRGVLRFWARQTWELRLDRPHTEALFTSTQNPKFFQNFPSHRIFRRMHEVLNIDENKN